MIQVSRVRKKINGDAESRPVEGEVFISTPSQEDEPLCPRPVNGKPDNTTMAECILAGDCGCTVKGHEYAQMKAQDPLTRFCPSCGLVGEVGEQYRDCCPDGSDARIIPLRLAEKCHFLFKGALEAACARHDNGGLRKAAEELRDFVKKDVRWNHERDRLLANLDAELDKAK